MLVLGKNRSTSFNLLAFTINFSMIQTSDAGAWIESLKTQQMQTFPRQDITSFLRKMPKVELHAHLNGCIRESTLLELANERDVTLSSLLHDLQEECHASTEEKQNESEQDKVNKKRRSLVECFEIFGEIANCVTDLEALRRIAREALEDFANDGVAYLELRSTPKILFFDGTNQRKCTKREYVETILDVMREFEDSECERYARDMNARGGDTVPNVRLPMKARFIVSVNRSDSVDDAIAHAELAIELANEGNKYVVGLDLSGNPMKNTFKDLEPSFRLVREAGLKVSIHCGEIPCSPDSDDPMVQFGFKETRDILAFRPDRLGHALLLTDEMYDDLETIYDKIPIESCPTSNVMTLELATHYEGDLVHGLRQHPRLKRWIDYDYPVSISTDDPGIFNTNPTTELILLVEAFHFENPWKIVSMMINSVDHIFETDEFKLKLKETLTKEIQTISKLYVKM